MYGSREAYVMELLLASVEDVFKKHAQENGISEPDQYFSAKIAEMLFLFMVGIRV